MSKIIALYRPTRIDRLQARIAHLCGRTVYEWANPDAPHRIAFPPSREWTPIMLDARERLARYRDRHWQHAPDVYMRDYVCKTYDLLIGDYTAFRVALAEQHADDHVRIVGSRVLRRIHDGEAPTRSLIFFLGLPVAFFLFVRTLLRASLLSLMAKGDVEHPEVLYVRKKVYPDLSVSARLGAAVRAQDLTFAGSFLAFGRAKERYGFFFLNAFAGAGRLVRLAAWRVARTMVSDARFFYRAGVPVRLFSTYLRHALHAAMITGLRSRLLTGVLVDKPFFVLLARYKRAEQRMVSLNEFFSFYPYRGFDYNHLDIYYSMNAIDAAQQNKHGGRIHETRHIPFFRQHQVSTGKGISKDLQVLLAQYKTRVLATTTQIATRVYSQWSTDELCAFIRTIGELARANPNQLFIIKGKKGELRAMPADELRAIEAQPNVYVIHSDVPRMLEYNQFEDLLPKANVLISMAHQSTTVWQAIASGIPAIAVNDVHPKSFLSEYKHLEVPLDALADALTYWLTVTPEAWQAFREQLVRQVNISDADGMQIVAKDILKIQEDV